MKVKRIFIGILAVVMMLSLAACSSGPKMSEEEIKDACSKEAENYVGGYLSNSSANFLKKYDNDPEELLGRYKLSFHYDFYTNSDVADMVCDYIIEHATFEVNPYSFYMNEDANRVEMAVNVTIIPPSAAKNQIEDILKHTYVGDGDDAARNDLYNQAISIISGIQPVTASIPIELAYGDGEWMIQNYWMVMKHINEAGSPE